MRFSEQMNVGTRVSACHNLRLQLEPAAPDMALLTALLCHSSGMRPQQQCSSSNAQVCQDMPYITILLF